MTPEIAAQIQAEQDHGRQKYGGHPQNFEHDDGHHGHDWHQFIDDHNWRGRDATPQKRRQHLIKVAGLAVSAIEAHDRKQKAMAERVEARVG